MVAGGASLSLHCQLRHISFCLSLFLLYWVWFWDAMRCATMHCVPGYDSWAGRRGGDRWTGLMDRWMYYSSSLNRQIVNWNLLDHKGKQNGILCTNVMRCSSSLLQLCPAKYKWNKNIDLIVIDIWKKRSVRLGSVLFVFLADQQVLFLFEGYVIG